MKLCFFFLSHNTWNFVPCYCKLECMKLCSMLFVFLRPLFIFNFLMNAKMEVEMTNPMNIITFFVKKRYQGMSNIYKNITTISHIYDLWSFKKRHCFSIGSLLVFNSHNLNIFFILLQIRVLICVFIFIFLGA